MTAKDYLIKMLNEKEELIWKHWKFDNSFPLQVKISKIIFPILNKYKHGGKTKWDENILDIQYDDGMISGTLRVKEETYKEKMKQAKDNFSEVLKELKKNNIDLQDSFIDDFAAGIVV